MLKYFLGLVYVGFCIISIFAQRPRDIGIKIGILPTGKINAITDVGGVMVGHSTIKAGGINTGVTAILPHSGNIFQQKVPAAVFVSNGFGKLAGMSQVVELGNIETPVILTNTLSVPAGIRAVVNYILKMPGNEQVRSVNAIVGETNDGRLNDIRGMHVEEMHVLEAIKNANEGIVEEGSIGAGSGTVCFGFKGGIGTSSRKLPIALGGYTIGVLVQTNFGGILQINGVPVGQELQQHYLSNYQFDNGDGSCMIIVATDAPLSPRNLERVASRAIFGLAKTGSIGSNGSGDYVIAFSTHPAVRIPHSYVNPVRQIPDLNNDEMSPLFLATIEATEEAIINSLFAAREIEGTEIKMIPVERVLDIMKKYQRLN